MSVSILIQTLNEEKNLARCVESLRWSDDIVVLDSYSTDRTQEIARAYGARWIQHTYKGRAAHQNWAMENIQWKHPWIYYSDADEVVPESLAREILLATSDPDNPNAAYKVKARYYFAGKWIRHSSQYPVWYTRLFRPDRIRWERKSNPVAKIDGPVSMLKNDFLHYPFSKGFEDWLWRHNRYSTYEAEETVRSLQTGDFHFSELFARDFSARRYALKKLSFRLPCRPLLKFLYIYFCRMGFLDGSPGFHYALLQSFYEYQIVLKARELRNQVRVS